MNVSADVAPGEIVATWGFAYRRPSEVIAASRSSCSGAGTTSTKRSPRTLRSASDVHTTS